MSAFDHAVLEQLQTALGYQFETDELITTALADVSTLRAQPSPAHEALKLAIWSDKSKIDPAEVTRLEVLWGKYFEPVSPSPGTPPTTG